VIVSVARYQTFTLDTTSSSASVTGALVIAQDLVEEYLDRWLESASRTETLTIKGDGRVYPRAIPVTSPPSGAETDFHGRAIRGVTWDTGPVFELSDVPNRVSTITYTGGYLAYADPLATDDTRIPVTIERAIAHVARGLITSGPDGAPPGAKAVSVGDVSVQFDTIGSLLDELAPGITTGLRRYRRASP
jgi:hypothetical protein